MTTGNEARRAALEARELVREVGKEAMAPDRRGHDLRNRRETVRAVVSEEMAWALLYGVEPRLSVDEEANFHTITGFRALHSNESAKLPFLFGRTPPPGLWPERAETLDPTIPEGRWHEFLASDDIALGILARLEALADEAEVPEDFVLPLRERRQSAPLETAENRVRGLAWLLVSRDRECLELAAELCRRRDPFVWGPDGPPMARS